MSDDNNAKSTSDFLGLIKLIYTHNPFYAISACLMLYGFSSIFSSQSDAHRGWMLLITLGSYSLVMAIFGVLIVRLAHVWEDARTIMLIVITLLLATSVSFDEILLDNPVSGVPILLVGLIVAVLITEGIIRGTRIKVARIFRLPYYLMLLVAYLYPIILSLQLEVSDWGEKIMPVTWGVWVFPWVVGGLFLTLVPVVRRGKIAAEDNGTPWNWPCFPWGIFAIMGLALAIRSFWLAISFYPGSEMQSPWSLWFLSPMIIGAAVVVLEYGHTHAKKYLVNIALALPLLAMSLLIPAMFRAALAQKFMSQMSSQLMPPTLIVGLTAVVFYAYALVRGVQVAEVFLTLGLLSLFEGGVASKSSNVLTMINWWPAILLCAVHVWKALQTYSSWRVLTAFILGVMALCNLLQETWFMGGSGVLPIHLIFSATIGIGLVARDRFVRVLQGAGAFMFVGLSVAAALNWLGASSALLAWSLVIYSLVIVGGVIAVWRKSGNIIFAYVLLAQILTGLFSVGFVLYRFLMSAGNQQGTLQLFWGTVFFLLAVGVSLAKAGAFRKLYAGVVKIIYGDDELSRLREE